MLSVQLQGAFRRYGVGISTQFQFRGHDGFGSVQVVRSLLLLDDRQKALGNQLEGLLSLTTGPIEHNLLAGFEARRLTDVFTLDAALLPTIDLYNPVETVSEPLFIIPGQSSAADARTNNFGLYFVDQLRFSEQFQLFVGGRWDGLDYEDQVTSTAREARPASLSWRTIRIWSWIFRSSGIWPA